MAPRRRPRRGPQWSPFFGGHYFFDFVVVAVADDQRRFRSPGLVFLRSLRRPKLPQSPRLGVGVGVRVVFFRRFLFFLRYLLRNLLRWHGGGPGNQGLLLGVVGRRSLLSLLLLPRSRRFCFFFPFFSSSSRDRPRRALAADISPQRHLLLQATQSRQLVPLRRSRLPRRLPRDRRRTRPVFQTSVQFRHVYA